MATKKISVNPDFFKMGKSKTLKKERKKRSARNSDYAENKELKMKLINKIKQHKQMEKERKKENTESSNASDSSIHHDLNNSLDYLQSLSAKHKSKKEKRRERKLARRLERQRLQQLQQQQIITQPMLIQMPQQTIPQQQTNNMALTQSFNPISTPLIQVNTPSIQQQPYIISPKPNAYIVNDTPQDNAKPDPPYGILKHGKKPLFSMYNKTLKKPRGLIDTQSSAISILNTPPTDNGNVNGNVNVHTDSFFERQHKLNQLKQQHQQQQQQQQQQANNYEGSIGVMQALTSSSNLKPGKTLKKMKQLHTTTKRFIHLGKKDGRVGVLIKNQKTRKKILKDTQTLKKRPLSKIKNYLRKHNLIKIGSTAPEHIIRSIYENSFLSGDVYNKNVDMLLHNYLDS